ncbi:mitochondrial enolase superfamily member 1 isoform X2 [Nilaparvata lugens]|uniref:mitochondrial enolase superfamily member 1 isoform X2 n=1 Tax=Nilaparvata lugens TaxID=108931 RepID=UPI00193E4A5B|nr:mitochondrial enolase superfamily member 1 isoform X2 [Nilaparvata lugens]
MAGYGLVIASLDVKDIRFPTSLEAHGSDAMHGDPDYSCAYVIINLKNSDFKGYGLTFTLGRGTEVVTQAIHSLSQLAVGKNLDNIYDDFAGFWRTLTSESQLRWIGPEKGVIHLATAAIVNALWDLWARLENKPVWKLLVDLPPEKIVSTVDFRYISDVVTKEEAIRMLKDSQKMKKEREDEMKTGGYPAYTTQPGWLGYKPEKVRELCKAYMDKGFKAFKIKVGNDLESDRERCQMVRNIIGWENILMTDANQVWDVEEAIVWMKSLAEFKPYWIEEPTSPDDILGHKRIAESLEEFGIKVATGEMCSNRIMFKQFMQTKALHFCQIDSCRLGGVNEILAVYFMAKKLNVPVCPHAGGVGLCEMVQHLQIFDYISLSATKEDRFIEYVDQEHDHFEDTILMRNAHYVAPTQMPGYSTKFKTETINDYEFPNGNVWSKILAQ